MSDAGYNKNLVDDLIRTIAECHDGTKPDGLWCHLRRDPDAFRRAVRHVLDRHLLSNVARDVVREGGAAVSVDVRVNADRWHGERVIPGFELRQSAFNTTKQVRLALEYLTMLIDLERSEDGS